MLFGTAVGEVVFHVLSGLWDKAMLCCEILELVNQIVHIDNNLWWLKLTLDFWIYQCYIIGWRFAMGMIRRMLGYATVGATKETAKRAWKSESLVDSAVFAAQTGMLAEAAKNLLGPEIGDVMPEVPEKNDEKK
jgi:hypothetical protein